MKVITLTGKVFTDTSKAKHDAAKLIPSLALKKGDQVSEGDVRLIYGPSLIRAFAFEPDAMGFGGNWRNLSLPFTQNGTYPFTHDDDRKEATGEVIAMLRAFKG